MRAYLFDGNTIRESDRVDELAPAVGGPGYVWLDIEDPTDQTVMRPVPLEPPALQWLGMFGQPALFHFQSATLRVVTFAMVGAKPVEVHVLGSEHALVSVHHDAHVLFSGLRDRAAHLSAMQQQVDAMQDSASHNMQTYVSMVATRQGQVINWVALVSIIFLPLTFLTGFFGMNFAWMVDTISGPGDFWILGVGLQVVVLGIVLFVARRLIPVLRGDLGAPGPPLVPDVVDPLQDDGAGGPRDR